MKADMPLIGAAIARDRTNHAAPAKSIATAVPIRSASRVKLKEDSTACSLLAVSRSEEHTSELQSLMRISYAVFCLKKKINRNKHARVTTIAPHITQESAQ